MILIIRLSSPFCTTVKFKKQKRSIEVLSCLVETVLDWYVLWCGWYRYCKIVSLNLSKAENTTWRLQAVDCRMHRNAFLHFGLACTHTSRCLLQTWHASNSCSQWIHTPFCNLTISLKPAYTSPNPWILSSFRSFNFNPTSPFDIRVQILDIVMDYSRHDNNDAFFEDWFGTAAPNRRALEPKGWSLDAPRLRQKQACQERCGKSIATLRKIVPQKLCFKVWRGQSRSIRLKSFKV